MNTGGWNGDQIRVCVRSTEEVRTGGRGTQQADRSECGSRFVSLQVTLVQAVHLACEARPAETAIRWDFFGPFLPRPDFR